MATGWNPAELGTLHDSGQLLHWGDFPVVARQEFCAVSSSGERALVWVSVPDRSGWGCSHCSWFLPTPTLLSGLEAKAAFDRLARGKFHDHNCEVEKSHLGSVQHKTDIVQRARMLIMRGYKPKDAVELALRDIALEHRNDANMLASARMEAEAFLSKLRTGLI